MKYTAKLKVGLLTLALIVTSGFIVQPFAQAASTVPGENELVSINNVDGQGTDTASSPQAISRDGDSIIFTSEASNLPSSNGLRGLYLRKISTGQTTRIDISTSGALPNFRVGSAAISETGRYIAFVSIATNLIDDTTSDKGSTYVRDTQLGTTTKVRQPSMPLNSADWDLVTGISNDGRFIIVETKFFPSPSPWRPAVIVYIDTLTSTNLVLGNPQSGETSWSNQASMSCDGSFVVFQSHISSLPKLGYGGHRVILADMRNSNSPAYTAISGNRSYAPQISCNGNFITYVSQNSADDPTPIPTGMSSYAHLVRFNRIDSSRAYVDSNSAGTFDNNTLVITSSATSRQPDTFYASIADSGDTVFRYNGVSYLKHLSDGSGTLERLQQSSGGTYYTDPVVAYLSGNGKYVTYVSPDAYDLGLLTSPSAVTNAIRSSTGL